MPATTEKTHSVGAHFWRGFKDGAPFVLVVGPFAALFGVLATEAGLNVFETLAFSVVVIAGAAQFTALQLMAENAPTAIILASALAVNLRMTMYSAALTPWLGAAPLWQRSLIAYVTLDQSYACAMLEFERRTEMTLRDRVAYFFGTTAPVVPAWYVCTALGAMIGTQIPDYWALDFALPITFLALVAPMLRTPAHLVAAAVGITVSLLMAWLPYSTGVLFAGLVAMICGARTEVWLDKKRAAHD